MDNAASRPLILAETVAQLDAWLDTMRCSDGYGGPVSHWWRNSFQFTGAGLDWRYEGIIIGYLNLYQKTSDEVWLTKACRAADDLVSGQLPNGNFRNSSFEQNPHWGGTPHEAACDAALLCLVEVLQKEAKDGWQPYLLAAEKNLEEYYFARLWDDKHLHFRDHPDMPGFVPNKSATLCEAILKLARVSANDAVVTRYVIPTLDAILAHQVPSGAHSGAIAQLTLRGQRREWYFPYYIARCASGLFAGYQYLGDKRYLEGALKAMRFVLGCMDDDDGFPQVIYANGAVNRYPRWIAATGDIARVIEDLIPLGLDADPYRIQKRILQNRTPSGAIRTADGFASEISQRRAPRLSEFRDVMPVCGWVDKAFRYLTQALPAHVNIPPAIPSGVPHLETCLLGRDVAGYLEDSTTISLYNRGLLAYQWIKGTAWASVCTPELLWK